MSTRITTVVQEVSADCNRGLTVVISDGMLLQWARETGCTFEYLESLKRGGYFDGVQPDQINQHLALIELTREGQELGMWT